MKLSLHDASDVFFSNPDVKDLLFPRMRCDDYWTLIDKSGYLGNYNTATLSLTIRSGDDDAVELLG